MCNRIRDLECRVNTDCKYHMGSSPPRGTAMACIDPGKKVKMIVIGKAMAQRPP
jgi:hypothetical protein